MSSASTSKITPSKVEITLRKKEGGLKWKTLEGTDAPKPSAASTTVNENDTIRAAVLKDSAPSYPTSSKSGPKNWDKVVSDITAKPKKKKKDDNEDGEDGEDEGGVDDMDDLDYGGDEANFFQNGSFVTELLNQKNFGAWSTDYTLAKMTQKMSNGSHMHCLVKEALVVLASGR